MKKQLNGNFLISYDKALQIDSKYSLAWNNKGLALKNLGQFLKAIIFILNLIFISFDKALQIDSKN